MNPSRPTIICLCGSSRFQMAFAKAAQEESLRGRIVLAPFVNTKAQCFTGTAATKRDLDQLHLRKIDMADEILVINVDDYIGESTQNEIRYAKSVGKPIRFLLPTSFDPSIPAAFLPITHGHAPSTPFEWSTPIEIAENFRRTLAELPPLPEKLSAPSPLNSPSLVTNQSFAAALHTLDQIQAALSVHRPD